MRDAMQIKHSGTDKGNPKEKTLPYVHPLIGRWLVLVLLGLWTIAGLFFVFWGISSNDEGWYCLISREVWKGRILYADMRFTQMPFLPHFYGGILSFLPPQIESGRLLSLALAVMGVVLLWRTCRERYGWHAALAGLLVLLLHKSFLAQMTQVRTQALTFALGALCFYCVSMFQSGRFKRDGWVAGAGLAAGALLLTRLSLLPLTLFLPFFIAASRQIKGRVRFFLLTSLGAWCIPALVAIYFCFVAGDRFWFGIYGFHAQLASDENRIWWFFYFLYHSWYETGLWTLLVLMAGSLLWIFQKNRNHTWRHFSFEWLVFVAWVGSTVIHLSRQPSFATYQTPLAWAPVILTAWSVRQALVWQRYKSLSGAISRSGLTFGRLITILILACGMSITFQDGRIVAAPSLRPQGLREILLEAKPRAGEKLITFEAGVAFCEPELEIIPGYEMSEFSLVPVMPGERQEELRGVSLAKFKHDLQIADLLIIRSRDLVRLAVGSSQQIKLVSDLTPDWRLVSSLENYGQFGEAVEVWRRKPHP